MDLHTWIFIAAILAYLYFITKVFDGFKILFIKKIKIHLPNPDNKKDEARWESEVYKIKEQIKKYKKQQLLYFLIIPATEIILHLIVGNYEINSQLLSLTFFILFLIILLLILLLYKGRKITKFQKKYTVKRQGLL